MMDLSVSYFQPWPAINSVGLQCAVAVVFVVKKNVNQSLFPLCMVADLLGL